MRPALILGLLMICAPASAQTMTNCVANGQVVNCMSNDVSPPPLPVYPPQRRSGDKSAAENIVSLFHHDPKKQVGKLLAKGKCADAQKAALKTGDMEYAAQVRDYCASQPVQRR